MNFPVFDLHCDTALGLLGKDLRSYKSLKQNDLHIDLNRAGKLPGYCQCFACFTTPSMTEWSGVAPETVFQKEMDIIFAEIERNKPRISLAYSGADVRKNYEKGKMSALLTIEGPAGFGFDPALLEDLHKVGFRISTLGWNERNMLTGSHETGGGLTDLGREYVRQCQALGIAVDVSHISDEAFWQILEITQKPILASHSNSRAVWNVSRNLTDDMFRAICQTGGVAGINGYSGFLGQDPDLDTLCDHIFHFLELDPEGRHISLGGDLDGCEALPRGFQGVQDYPALAQRLLDRGLEAQTVQNIFWENALTVLDNCAV